MKVFTKETPDDLSKVVSVQIEDIMEKCEEKDGEMFAMNVGWVRSTGRRIITGYWIEES
jgi:hypothetical protein